MASVFSKQSPINSGRDIWTSRGRLMMVLEANRRWQTEWLMYPKIKAIQVRLSHIFTLKIAYFSVLSVLLNQ